MNRRTFAQSSLLGMSALLMNSEVSLAADLDKKALGSALRECIAKGEVCLQHCIEMLGRGDTSMAACAVSVRDMMNLCQSLSTALVQNSKHITALAKLAGQACVDCETECRKHTKHPVCKDCGEACASCAKLCKTA